MKTLLYVFLFLVSFIAHCQSDTDKDVTVLEKQNDDIYLAGDQINIKAPIHGDAVIAGGTIVVRDTISQDLVVAGGDITVKGYVHDDIRAAGGTLIIDTTVGDDVIVFGGEVHITEDAIIHGNLISFSGTIVVDGTVMGFVKASGGDLKINGKIAQGAELRAGDLKINGEITGTTKIVAENITIGNNAKFFDDVEYWSTSGAVDFKNALVNTSAHFNQDLARDEHDFPWEFFGIAAIGVWIFYILSAFLIIFIFNILFRKFLSKTIVSLDSNMIKNLGYGLMYLFGLPLLILICFVILIGIPIGLLLGAFYLFSILVGHLVVALLIAHYLNNKNQNSWGIWMLSFVALGIAIVLRFITFIPFLGALISLIIIAIAYGLIILSLKNNKSAVKLTES